MSSRWDTSGAKFVIQTDLMSGVLELDNPSPQEAWDQVYSHMFEFRFIKYEKFVTSLALERRRFSNNANRAAMEEVHMRRDRQLNPRSQINTREEPVFDLHPAKLALREDIIAGRHLGMTPADFQETNVLYQSFALHIFTKRIYQEEKLQKYYNYRNQKSRYRGIDPPGNDEAPNVDEYV